MITELLGDFAVQVTDAIASTGYFGIFIAMAIESCLIPLPSELIMPFAGFMVSQGQITFLGAVLAGGFGNLAGSLVAYYIGVFLPEKKLLELLEKYGRFILISPHEYKKTKSWFKKNGNAVSFFSRLIPGVRTVISLPAGMAKISLLEFSIYTLAGSLIWSAFLGYIGLKLGENWDVVGSYLHKFDLVVVIVFLALGGFYVYKKLSEFRENK